MTQEAKPSRTFALYGKGGSGKSTIACHLSQLFQESGQRVLQIGCDPKADSSHLLLEPGAIQPVMPYILREDLDIDANPEAALAHVVKGAFGIDCIEAGGPVPGRGCAGLGISTTLTIFEQIPGFFSRYDVVVYDVLGDVVCGGFAVPLRSGGQVREVYIVLSADAASVYAANNIARAVVNNSASGAKLGGLIYNREVPDAVYGRSFLDNYAERIGTRVVGSIPADTDVVAAAAQQTTVLERFPDSEVADAFRRLHNRISASTEKDLTVPTPLENEEMLTLLRQASQTALKT